MNKKIANRIRANGALLVSVTGLCGLLVYVLACVYSPVSWSPDSSKIALFVSHHDNDVEVMGMFTYDLKTGQKVLIDNMTGVEMSSGPSWSPDGKWIAYYKIESQQPDPNNEAGDVPAEKDTSEVEKVTGEPVLELFSEENKMLPGFTFEAGKGLLEENPDEKTSVVKVVVVSADGKEKKIERSFRWLGDDADDTLLYTQPQWSGDSQTVFYYRHLENDLYYISSLNITTDHTEAYAFAAVPTFYISPDNRKLASVLQDSLVITNLDASMTTYHSTASLESDAEQGAYPIGWSPDSEKVILAVKHGFAAIDAESGKKRIYIDKDAQEISRPFFSRNSRKVYYLAKLVVGDPPESEEIYAIRSMNLDSEKVDTVMPLNDYEIDDEGIGWPSVSPDGRIFVIRAVIENALGNDVSALIIRDGSGTRTVDTDSWLEELVESPAP